MPAHEPGERRKQPRLPRRLPARFGTDAKMSGGTVVDVSEGGMRIESPDAYPVNSTILVFVQFPRHSVRLRARVSWASGKGSSNPAMGLTFTQPEPSLAKAYKEWVAEIRLMASEKPGPGGKQAPAAGPETAGAKAEAAAPASAEPPVSPPRPEPAGPIRRRMESRQGQSYEALLEHRSDGWQLTIVQMPRQIGVGAPDFQGTYRDHAAAETALREFVRAH